MDVVGGGTGLDAAESSVGLTITTLVSVDTTPLDPVTVRVTLVLVETGIVVLFVPFGNEWVGINVGNEVMSVGGADIVEFGNDCAVASAGRRMAERNFNEYCMVFDSFRLLIIVNFVVKIWKHEGS